MAVKIRLARGGAKKNPFYKIVAANDHAPRDGKFLEKLGTYNPMLPKDHQDRVKLATENIKYWLSVGAKPTEKVTLLLADAGIVERPAVPNRPIKSKPGAKAIERAEAKKAKLEG